jgi:hypothetical protein
MFFIIFNVIDLDVRLVYVKDYYAGRCRNLLLRFKFSLDILYYDSTST